MSGPRRRRSGRLGSRGKQGDCPTLGNWQRINEISSLFTTTPVDSFVNARVATSEVGQNMAMGITLDQVRERREAIRGVLEARGAVNPRLFGSVARGKADEKSDLDILIDFRQPAPEGFAYFGALDQLEHELSHLLGTQVHVTVIDPSSPSGRRILSEALPL